MPALTESPPEVTPAEVTAQAFVRAVVDGDGAALRRLLSEDVWFRALLPRGLVEHHDRASALATLDGWVGGAAELHVLATFNRTSGIRQHVGWRLRLRPGWAPDVWHLIEQVGYVRIGDDGSIRRVDLVCTGFQPQPHDRPVVPAT